MKHDPLDTSRISPTAFFTGHTWVRNGLGDPALVHRRAAVMHAATRAAMNPIARCMGVPTLEDMLVARHRGIDARLDAAIRQHGVRQVVELASGLSARGLRMTRQYEGLRWIDADLPGMARRKRERIAQVHGVIDDYEVAEVNVLHTEGAHSIERLAERLEPGVATAVITEGLTMYFPLHDTQGIWRRIRGLFGAVGGPGVYLSDLHLHADLDGFRPAQWFVDAVERVARGGVHIHFDTVDEVTAALLAAGFDDVFAHVPRGPIALDDAGERPLVRVLEARVAQG